MISVIVSDTKITLAGDISKGVWNNMVEFGEQLRKAREEKGMTQQTLAEQLFVTRQAVSKWECGERYPDLPTTKKISESLDVSLDDLLSGKDMNKVVERNSIIDNNVAEKLLLGVYAIFLYRCFGLVYQDCFFFNYVKTLSNYKYFHLDSFLKENISWIMMPMILFSALTLVLVYGFIRAAKGTLSPKIIGLIGIITFATSSLMNVTQILTVKILPLVFEKLFEYNYSIDYVNSVIKPNFILLFLILLPAVIGAVATFFYFIRGNNKIIWQVLFILMSISEIIISYKFMAYWTDTRFRLPSNSQAEFFEKLNMLEGMDPYKYTFCIVVYIFLLLQIVALWIKRIKIARDVASNESNNIPSEA